MDSSDFAHLQQKIRVEQIRNVLQQQQVPSCPPPPYEDDDSDVDSNDEDNETAEDELTGDLPPASSLPMKLVINAANRIQGNNNLVPTSACPLADASNFSGLLMQAVSELNSIAAEQLVTAGGQRRAARPLKVDLTINCGITVIGDRNVVGNVGLRPKAGTPMANMAGGTNSVFESAKQAAETPAASAGAKRKIDEVSDVDNCVFGSFTDLDQTSSAEDEPVAKRVVVEIENE